MRTVALLACCVVAAGCGDSKETARPPVVSNVGGPVMAHPQIVPIFFSDDPDVATLTAFSQWIGTSRWLDEVGAEYGVGSSAVLGVVHEPAAAPIMISDPEIVDRLYAGLADGSLPQPPGGDPREVLYVFAFPSTTVVTSFGDTSCVGFSGYHSSARRNGVELSYAVLASCSDFSAVLRPVEARELVMSHELIEAATDPIPTNHPAFQLRDATRSWQTLGGEVADLCEGSVRSIWREGGFVAQRSWSNAAAAVGDDPCVPIPDGDRYYNAVVSAGVAPRVPPGGKIMLGLAGMSSMAIPDWTIEARSAKDGDATLTLGSAMLNAGKSTNLSVEVPATAAKGSTVRMYVFSVFTQTDYEVLGLSVYVDDPCSSFTSCEVCSSHLGCGFCATTGRCEAEGASGSAESSCPAKSFATWPGSCPGFCEAHRASCNECSSQPGCGWCASGGGQCLGASHDYAEPEGAACDYADWSFSPDYCPG